MTSPLLSVDEARHRILSGVQILSQETISLQHAQGRLLARALSARHTQPPVDVSAMDGYALRTEDLAKPNGLRLIGESAAGHGFEGLLGEGETVRIFTGAPVPKGADAVLLQEDALRSEDGMIHPRESVLSGENIREKGLDFSEGQATLSAGSIMGPAELALAAAMNHAEVPVVRRPRIAIMASGDELILPGKNPGPSQIIACNSFAVAGLARDAGGDVIDLGLFKDDLEQLQLGISQARALKVDILVTLGGASVGDHDLLRPALLEQGMKLDFWRIAMRPGKPLIYGSLGEMRILGLPGNPVAAFVCSLVFLCPLIRAMQGDPQASEVQMEPAIIGLDLPANKSRRDYMRASLTRDADNRLIATPQPLQDSSLLTELTQSQALLVREAGASALMKGDPCSIIRLAR
ncbi:MAG: gephyrin-like molybdotransferase Glp [Methylocystis sp.]